MMKRRSLLSLFGGAVLAPGIGPKEAAKILGVHPHPPAPMPVSQAVEGFGENIGWWGSALEIRMGARRAAVYEAASQDRYAHMKSWGPAFKRSVVQREIQIERMLEAKCQRDEEFMKRVMGLL